MNWWWVNHSLTGPHEVNSGYLWSPRTNKDLSFNHTYENMALAPAQSPAKEEIGVQNILCRILPHEDSINCGTPNLKPRLYTINALSSNNRQSSASSQPEPCRWDAPSGQFRPI